MIFSLPYNEIISISKRITYHSDCLCRSFRQASVSSYFFTYNDSVENSKIQNQPSNPSVRIFRSKLNILFKHFLHNHTSHRHFRPNWFQPHLVTRLQPRMLPSLSCHAAMSVFALSIFFYFCRVIKIQTVVLCFLKTSWKQIKYKTSCKARIECETRNIGFNIVPPGIG